jgi:hypothetical protein
MDACLQEGVLRRPQFDVIERALRDMLPV